MKSSDVDPVPSVTFLPVRASPASGVASEFLTLHVDTRGTRCPTPLLRLRKALRRCEPGQVLELTTDDPAAFADVPRALAELPAQLFATRDEGAYRVFVVLRC